MTWEGNDLDAIKYLYKRGYVHKHFIWQIPKNRRVTKKEDEAFDYLFHEWDWGSELVKEQTK